MILMKESDYIKSIIHGLVDNFVGFCDIAVDEFFESYTGKLTSKIAMADLISKVHTGLSGIMEELSHEED